MEDRPNIHNIRKPDGEVWQALKEGDKAALEEIFRRYYADLYRYGVKLTGQPALVEDNIQDLYLKIWNNRENLGDVRGVKTYLWTALRRRLIAKTQKRAGREKRFSKKSREDKAMTFSAEELIIHQEYRKEQTQALKQALNQLSGKHREIMYLKYYEGMSYEEIQDLMGISYQTARNYVYEGLGALRAYISGSPVSIVLAATGITSVIYATRLLFRLC